MKKTLFILLLISTGAFAQSTSKRQCGTMQHLSFMKKQNPQIETEMQQYNQKLDEWIYSNLNQNHSSSVGITIPIVFHVIYNKADENISDAEIKSQIASLNADLTGTNADASKIPAVFKDIADSPEIQFCLAGRTPDDKPTTGIVRIETTRTNWEGELDDMKFKAKGGDDAWDPSRYFNVWVCHIKEGDGYQIAGVAEFPKATVTNTYGCVLDYRYTGGVNSIQRVATHEAGHCFNLHHIWGDNECGDDRISDTPPQKDCNFGCPVFPHVTCNNGPNGDMFMNYMDYVDDSCMNMFTKGQAIRMLAVLNIPPYNSLKTSNGCTPVGTNAVDNFLTIENTLDAFPNPSNGIINFSFTINNKSSYLIEIRNLLGQEVFKDIIFDRSGNYKQSVNLQQHGKGCYSITVTNENTIQAKKIVIY